MGAKAMTDLRSKFAAMIERLYPSEFAETQLQAADMLAAQAAEIERLTRERDEALAEVARLRERIEPRGLVVVEHDNVGHYVSQKVADIITLLRAHLAGATERAERAEVERDDMTISWTGPEATKALLAERDAAREALAVADRALEPFARLADTLVDGGLSVAVGLVDEHFLAARYARSLIVKLAEPARDGDHA
jgi:hypothetical protein